MPVHNLEIAEVFEEVADILEIQGANPYRVRAYRNAARAVGNWPENLGDILKRKGRLPRIPGVGEDLSGKIEEIIFTGKLRLLAEVRRQVPPGLVELLRIPNLGPKRVQVLQKKLGVRNHKDLERVIKSGELIALAGFGEKIRDKILDFIRKESLPGAGRGRFKFMLAEQTVGPLLDYLRSIPEVENAVVAGSFRRKMETVGDLDLLVSCRSGVRGARRVMQRFVEFEDVEQILPHGDTRSTVVLRHGIQVDLRVVPAISFGAALHYFTGSKAHNIAVRAIGVRQGLKINEYGIFRGARRIGGRDEEEVFRSVGLPYIEPELREARGEIDAARKGRLPQLITLDDIRGDLHAHSQATDGRLSIQEMAEAAMRCGYEYLAITDHTQHLTVARGLDKKRLLQQIKEIERLNGRFRKFRILRGSEVDILEDGSLDLPDEILKELDVRVCSIHYRFELSEKKQTERVIRAMDNPYFNILGHPTGRLLDRRRPYELNLEQVMKAAKERGCFMEINAQPERMDLNDLHCLAAKAHGVKLVISTDAHSDFDLNYMRYGVAQARRGWLEAPDVINTLPLSKLLPLFKR